MRYRLIALACAAICATCAFGQNSSSGSFSGTLGSGAGGGSGFSGSFHFGAPAPFGIRPVTGAPYSGEEIIEQVQTLADGTHITRRQASTKVYRDSMGRTRTERPIAPGLELSGRVSDLPTVIEITDPVAHFKYTLDTMNKVAHRQQLPALPELPARAAARPAVAAGTQVAGIAGVAGARVAAQQSDRPRPQMSNEKLGTQTVEGVLAEGMRMTNTWPVGSQGNDRPISVVNETWISPELKVTILTKTNDPRSGENTRKLTNISQAEPPANLFQSPPEYSVVDEAGDFTINWGSQK